MQVQQRDNEINILVSMLKKTQSSSGQVLAAVVAAPVPQEPPARDVDVGELLADRNKAFEVFRKSYRKNEAIEDNKALLKAKYGEAKGLGETVNATRQVTEGNPGTHAPYWLQVEILSEGSSLSPGKRLHRQRSSRHAMVPLSDASPHPEG